MSPRRLLVVMVAALSAIAGAATAVLALVGLQVPVWRGGELGTPADVSAGLRTAALVGAGLLLAGGCTVVLLVHRSLRGGR